MRFKKKIIAVGITFLVGITAILYVPSLLRLPVAIVDSIL